MNRTIADWRRYFAKREFSFFGNASILASGSAIASLISLASEPIASRLFPPEVFGIVYAFISLIAIVGLITENRKVHLALPIIWLLSVFVFVGSSTMRVIVG